MQNFRRNLSSFLIAGLAVIATSILALHAQVPGVNSTINSVFTWAYEVSTMKPTYSAATPIFTLASTPQDVCNISGSASKQIRLRRVILYGVATAVSAEPVAIIKRSTLNTGTGSQPSLVPYDASSSAASAVVEYWTANPTAGTMVGALLESLIQYANFTTGTGSALIIDFGRFGQPIVLRSATQNVSVNLAGTTVSGGQMMCNFEWTEE